MDKYIKMLEDEGCEIVKVIDTKTIATAPWVVLKCKYGCALYGSTRCCPPNSPTWKETRELLEYYHRGILFMHRELPKIKPLAAKLSGIAFHDDYYKSIGLGSGPCSNCKKCNFEKCNFPQQAIPAMEACGIDVFSTVRNNGIEIHTLEGEEGAQYFGLILID